MVVRFADAGRERGHSAASCIAALTSVVCAGALKQRFCPETHQNPPCLRANCVSRGCRLLGESTGVGSSIMALGSTMHTFTVQLADVDRGVYDELSLRAARHPSETFAYLVTRLLAYCLEFEEGIVFGESTSATEEPAILVRDLTGAITVWIEVGAPDAERLHYASKLADRTVVYTHRDPDKVMAPWAGKRIHHAEAIVLHSFDPGFIDAATHVVERRNAITLSVTERQLYLDLNGTSLSSAIHTRALAR